MSEAVAKLELDASGLTRGATEAEKAFNRVAAADEKYKRQASKKATDGLDGTTKRIGNVTRAYDGLFEKERKVKTNLAGLVSELSNANSAGQATAITINRLSETMRLGFAASIGTALGMTVHQAITDTANSLDSLTDKWQDLVKFDERNAGDSALVQNLEKAVALTKEASKESEKISNKVMGASAGYDLIAEGGEASRKRISQSMVASAQRSAFEAGLLASGGDQQVSKSRLLRQRDETISSVRSSEKFDPSQKERVIAAITSEYDSMIVQLTQKFATATVAAVRKAEASMAASDLSQISALGDSREVNARRLRNQRDSANMRFMDASVNAANRPLDPIAQQELTAASAERDSADFAVNANRFNQAINPETGTIRSSNSRLGEVRARQRRARNMARSAKDLSETGGLVGRLSRDSAGRVISGVDPETGERVSRTPSETGGLLRSDKEWSGLKEGMRPRSDSEWNVQFKPKGRGGFAFTSAEAATRDAAQTSGAKSMESVPKLLGDVVNILKTWAN